MFPKWYFGDLEEMRLKLDVPVRETTENVSCVKYVLSNAGDDMGEISKYVHVAPQRVNQLLHLGILCQNPTLSEDDFLQLVSLITVTL